MSGVKDVFKGGWHPKGKDGGKESWRGDYKGINQVAGWVGKGKQAGSNEQGSSHVSRPLATLKDPASFGPPPRNVNYHGGAALPNEITPHTGGIGAPLTQQEITSARYVATQPEEYEQEQEVTRHAPPPLPYRSYHTGLRTDNLPPPPIRRDVNDVHTTQQGPAKPTPSLPPRLPSRQNTASSPVNPTSSPPPAYEAPIQAKSPAANLNQTAMNRLGSAGVSVPSLGIGRKNAGSNDNPWKNETSQNNTVSELSSRFKRLNSNVSAQQNKNDVSAVSPQEQTTSAPTWAQTQSSLKTAQNFHKDPSSVSLADAQQAAATAQQAHNNAQAFRARHADRIDAAEKKATAMNKRYNMTGRLNRFLEDANNEHDQHQQQQTQPPPPPVHPNATVTTSQYQRESPTPPVPSPQTSQPVQKNGTTDTGSLTKSIGRKPPPPPPPKKPSALQAPPPVPLGTRPSFA